MRIPLALTLAAAVVAVTNAQVFTPPIPCGIALQDPVSGRPKIDGPPDLVTRVTVVHQEDSAVEITAVDLTKVKVVIAGPFYQIQEGGQFAVALRNRSDQPVYEVEGAILFQVGNHKDSGFGVGWLRHREPPIPPGGIVRVVFGSAGWSAGGPDGEVALFAAIRHIKFKDCAYVVQSSAHLSDEGETLLLRRPAATGRPAS